MAGFGAVTATHYKQRVLVKLVADTGVERSGAGINQAAHFRHHYFAGWLFLRAADQRRHAGSGKVDDRGGGVRIHLDLCRDIPHRQDFRELVSFHGRGTHSRYRKRQPAIRPGLGA